MTRTSRFRRAPSLGPALIHLALILGLACKPAASAESGESAAARHPLDPLSADEYTQALTVLRAAGHVNDATRFATLELVDPDKATVLAWRPGNPLSRRAFAVIKQGLQTFESVIDLSASRVMSWKEMPNVQPSVLVEEIVSVGEILGKHKPFVDALAVRGYSIDKLLCAPWTVGNYAIPAQRGRRLLKTACFVAAPGVSPFTRPIEGLWAVVDLNAHTVVEMHDDAVIPVSTAPARIDDSSAATTRAALKPVIYSQPGGSNVRLTGHLLEWDNWRLHFRIEKRSGLAVSMVRYRDGDRERSVLYQGALAELFVPYMDPAGNWYSRTFMDEGEYGFGANITPLEAGFDCPETGQLIDAVLPDDKGAPVTVPKAICIFERNPGDPAWRHYDNITGAGFEGRRAVELVLRSIASIGNYDYFLDWVFTEDGRIRVRIGATGYDGLKGVKSQSVRDATAAGDATHGTLVAPGLVAANHDHFFSVRLDVDVDGPRNSLAIDALEMKDFEGPRSGWVVRSRVARREREGQLDYDLSRPAHWRIINPDSTGPLGHAAGYVLHPLGSVAHSMLNAGDLAQQRAAFTEHQLWVTPRSPSERYAAGDYVNQSEPGHGLPAWTAANRSIENTDIVLWYTAGFHHVPRTEDFPLMPSAWHEFELSPFNFFARNPALDVRKGWAATAGR